MWLDLGAQQHETRKQFLSLSLSLSVCLWLPHTVTNMSPVIQGLYCPSSLPTLSPQGAGVSFPRSPSVSLSAGCGPDWPGLPQHTTGAGAGSPPPSCWTKRPSGGNRGLYGEQVRASLLPLVAKISCLLSGPSDPLILWTLSPLTPLSHSDSLLTLSGLPLCDCFLHLISH